MHAYFVKNTPFPPRPCNDNYTIWKRVGEKEHRKKTDAETKQAKREKKIIRKEAHETRPVKIKSWSFPGECGYRKQIA